MKIVQVEAIPLDIQFTQTFSFGTTDRKRSPNVILTLTTDDGLVGFGEACPVPAFTGETQESIVKVVAERVQPLLIDADPLAREPLIRSLERQLLGCPFTLTAVDIALWDLAGKALQQPISTLLGGRFHQRLTVHGSIGMGSAESMARTALQQVEQGFRTLKLYAGREELETDIARLSAVRAEVGPDIAFMLDVNGLWNSGTCLRALPKLAGLGVTLLEQPVPAWDGPGQAEVMRNSTIDIAADEAVFAAYDVARIGRERCASVINLGLSKLGGLLRARECATVARASGLGVMVGSVLELGIASVAGLHLAAALPELAHPSYLLGPLKYERQITSPEIVVDQGEMRVPNGPGLGVDVDTELINALDLRRKG